MLQMLWWDIEDLINEAACHLLVLHVSQGCCRVVSESRHEYAQNVFLQLRRHVVLLQSLSDTVKNILKNWIKGFSSSHLLEKYLEEKSSLNIINSLAWVLSI